MGTEVESVEQAAAARRERLRALRAAKELLSTPDGSTAAADADAADHGHPDETGEEDGRLGGFQDDDGKNREPLVTDEIMVSQAVAARHERVRALKAAKELLSTPDSGSVQTESSKEGSEDAEEEKWGSNQ